MMLRMTIAVVLLAGLWMSAITLAGSTVERMVAQEIVPETPRESAVWQQGVARLTQISQLDPWHPGVLDRLADLAAAARLILAFPQWPVVIEGHTDPSGKKAENQKLSLERAARIRTYLNEVQHIPRDRMHLRAYGSRRPVADNASEAGRQRNRRVDIRLVGELPPELEIDKTKKSLPGAGKP